jgi:hypothetical protein
VISDPAWRKGIQGFMNRQLSTSISRKHYPENPKGEGNSHSRGDQCPPARSSSDCDGSS